MINKIKFYKNEILGVIIFVVLACVVNGVKSVIEVAIIMVVVFSIPLIYHKIKYGKWFANMDD